MSEMPRSNSYHPPKSTQKNAAPISPATPLESTCPPAVETEPQEEFVFESSAPITPTGDSHMLEDDDEKSSKRLRPNKPSRGRPTKPPPTTAMTASRFISANQKLTISISDDTGKKTTFTTNPPRRNKGGKVGWTFSHKSDFVVDGDEVWFQITGNIYGIRSDQWESDVVGEEAPS